MQKERNMKRKEYEAIEDKDLRNIESLKHNIKKLTVKMAVFFGVAFTCFSFDFYVLTSRGKWYMYLLMLPVAILGAVMLVKGIKLIKALKRKKQDLALEEDVYKNTTPEQRAEFDRKYREQRAKEEAERAKEDREIAEYESKHREAGEKAESRAKEVFDQFIKDMNAGILKNFKCPPRKLLTGHVSTELKKHKLILKSTISGHYDGARWLNVVLSSSMRSANRSSERAYGQLAEKYLDAGNGSGYDRASSSESIVRSINDADDLKKVKYALTGELSRRYERALIPILIAGGWDIDYGGKGMDSINFSWDVDWDFDKYTNQRLIDANKELRRW